MCAEFALKEGGGWIHLVSRTKTTLDVASSVW